MFNPRFIPGSAFVHRYSLVPKLLLENALTAKLCFAMLSILPGFCGSPATSVLSAADDSPLYAGRTLSEWNDWFKALDLTSATAAAEAPALAQLATDSAAPPAARRQATLTLGRLDAAAAVAVPVLAQLLNDDVPTDSGDAPRSWALKSVALLGPPARELTPQIIELLNAPDTSALDRLLSLEALARIGPAHARSLPAVVMALEHGPPAAARELDQSVDLEFRTAAAGVLSLFGPSAAPAIPTLLEASRAEHEPLRRAAVTTLGMIGDAALREPLTDVLQFDDSLAVRDAAAVSLAQLGPQTTDLFTQLLGDSDATTRSRAADALRRLGPAARSSLPALRVALTDEATAVRIGAAEAIWSVSGEVPLPLDAAAELLAAPERETRMRAHRLLVDMGRVTHDPALLERLQSLSQSRDPRVRQAAYLALREVQQAAPQ